MKVDVRGSVLVGGGTDAALVGQTYLGLRDGFVLKMIEPTSDSAALPAP